MCGADGVSAAKISLHFILKRAYAIGKYTPRHLSGRSTAVTLRNDTKGPPAQPEGLFVMLFYLPPFSATQPRTYSTKRRVEADSAFSSFTAMPMFR